MEVRVQYEMESKLDWKLIVGTGWILQYHYNFHWLEKDETSKHKKNIPETYTYVYFVILFQSINNP